MRPERVRQKPFSPLSVAVCYAQAAKPSTGSRATTWPRARRAPGRPRACSRQAGAEDSSGPCGLARCGGWCAANGRGGVLANAPGCGRGVGERALSLTLTTLGTRLSLKICSRTAQLTSARTVRSQELNFGSSLDAGSGPGSTFGLGEGWSPSCLTNLERLISDGPSLMTNPVKSATSKSGFKQREILVTRSPDGAYY